MKERRNERMKEWRKERMKEWTNERMKEWKNEMTFLAAQSRHENGLEAQGMTFNIFGNKNRMQEEA